MKSITINGSQRESVGKSSTKALRNAGKVPCVVYGGEKPVHFSADEISFSKLIYTPNAHTVIISIDGKEEIKLRKNLPGKKIKSIEVLVKVSNK